jgi:gamma-glutamyltranspeptidase/glutathione hydrolase
VADAIVRAAQQGGGWLTHADLANYQARITEPLRADFRGYTLHCGPPPTSGATLFLPIMKALEDEAFEGPLRAAGNLDKIGRVWRVVFPHVARTVADVPASRALVETLLAPASIAELRKAAFAPPTQKAGPPRKTAMAEEMFYEHPAASTTHFIVVDRHGNIVCATQSQSLHFGAGVVPPGTGVVMNNSMSNFAFTDAKSLNYAAPGKRSRSTIAPTIVTRDGKPVLAIGIPGSGRIPTAILQVLLDRLAFNRPLGEAIGDTRIHFLSPFRREESEAIEAEQTLPHETAQALQALGWRVNLPEPAGTGRYFGGINAVELNADGTVTGFADPRRTNVAGGL